MSKNQPNLKVNVNSDTSGFTKGMASAKQELTAFSQTGYDSMSKLASLIGVNTQEVAKLVTVFNGAQRDLTDMGNTGTKTLNNIATAAKGVAGVMAGVGIAAATVAFKQLNAEAEAFKATIAGANIELQTQAYISTYKQFMHDVNAEQGKSMAEAQSNWKKFWATMTDRLATRIGGPAGSATAFSAMGDMYRVQNESLQQAQAVFNQAISAGQQAERLQGEIYDLQMKQLDASRRWADQEREIAQLRLEATDPANSPAERQRALTQLQEKTNALYEEQYSLQSQISQKMDEIDGLAENTIEDTEKSNAEYEKAQAILQKKADAQRSLLKLQKQIAAAAGEEAEAHRRTAEAIAKGVERQQALAQAQIELAVGDDSRQALADKLSEALATKPIEAPIRIKWEEKEVLDFTETIQQTLVEGVEGIADSIGTLLGNVMTGEGGVAEFGQDLLNMVGTFAQKFGKVLIAFGVASEAFKESLSSLDGIAAIAAGAALVVAGAAVKAVASSMSASVGGASSAGGYVASSGYSSGGGGYANSTLQVEVTGTLTANGSQLVAVLNNENNRTHYTT